MASAAAACCCGGGGGAGALKTALVALALVCACTVSDLHVVIGLTAAVCASFIIYILPGLAYYTLMKSEPGAVSVAAAGAGVGVGGEEGAHHAFATGGAASTDSTASTTSTDSAASAAGAGAKSAAGVLRKVGPDKQLPPRHRMPFHSI